ncbi:sensor histidine kinase [Martelella soudanensis]|uniref:sensor histidine kinase n=1 Tax=Martelella sp. NC20 TaxID=2740298 RepID=UPI0015DF1889|nr:ATP-binding protein [Martelella sp. NC20]
MVKELQARFTNLKLWSVLRSTLVVIGIAVCCAMPFFLSLPTPRDAVVLRSATLEEGGSPVREISLPYTRPHATKTLRTEALYRIHFTSNAIPADHPVLFFPAVRQTIDVRLNGIALERRDVSLLTSPRLGDFYAFDISPSAVRKGENELEILHSRVDGWISSYLSPVYLTSYSVFLPYQKLYGFLFEQWRFTSLLLKAMITISVIVIALLRPSDGFSRWFSLIMAFSLALTATQYGCTLAGTGVPRLYYATLQLGTLLIAVVLTLEMAGRKFVRKSLYIALGLPITLLMAYWAGVASGPVIAAIGNILSITAMVAALWIAIAHYFRSRDPIAAIIAIPLVLCLLFGLHDVGLLFGITGGAHMLTPYIEMATLLAALLIITIRLVQSLNQVDSANIRLRRKLDEQESELRLLNEKERRNATHMTLERERDRLMRDLHDGLSGYLVSIMAQTEREPLDRDAIRCTARDALGDLRLVIQSLDLSDTDLRVALASFRERTGPQLHRMGIRLDWLTTEMPVVTGVTPSNALALLRILQEAVTNAVKHGPATHISISATTNESGDAIITVENDVTGSPCPGKGHGLANMVKRARSFGGDVAFSRSKDKARLMITLPPVLRQQPA